MRSATRWRRHPRPTRRRTGSRPQRGLVGHALLVALQVADDSDQGLSPRLLQGLPPLGQSLLQAPNNARDLPREQAVFSLLEPILGVLAAFRVKQVGSDR